jgi:hypothetical protein
MIGVGWGRCILAGVFLGWAFYLLTSAVLERVHWIGG